jgi:hypothetical protein
MQSAGMLEHIAACRVSQQHLLKLSKLIIGEVFSAMPFERRQLNK